MKISQVFPSKYLTAQDLGGRSFTLRIRSVTLETMQTHDNKTVQKPVVWFDGAHKGLVLNVTNAKILAALYGDETDQWLGKRATLYVAKVKAFGAFEDAIRIREEIPAQPKPAAQAPTVEDRAGLDDGDDLTDWPSAAADMEIR